MADDIISLEKIFYKGASAAQRAQQIWPILVGWVVFGGTYLQENDFFKETEKLSPRLITFSPNQYGESHLRWPLITYGDLANSMGFHHDVSGSGDKREPNNLGGALFRIHRLCEACKADDLPILNSIVVNQQGMPGDGFPDWDNGGERKWRNAVRKVRRYKDWARLPVPTIQQLEEAVKES